MLWNWRTRENIRELYLPWHMTLLPPFLKENTRPGKGLAQAAGRRGKPGPAQTSTLVGVETAIKAFAAVHGRCRS
jgi:hypothetical protein